MKRQEIAVGTLAALFFGGFVTADEAEKKPIAAIMKLGGQIERDETTPGLPVGEVILSGDKATDGVLKHLAALTQLKSLQVIKTNVTDAGLKDLAALQIAPSYPRLFKA